MNPLLYPSLLIIPAVGSIATLTDNQTNLAIIFGFVLCLMIMLMISRHQRDKMWHETARLALEKGQPVPSRWELPHMGGRFRGAGPWGCWGPWWEIRRGFILIAVSIGLYFTLNERVHGWLAIPACIGAVYLLFGVFSLLRGDNKNPPDHRDPPAQL